MSLVAYGTESPISLLLVVPNLPERLHYLNNVRARLFPRTPLTLLPLIVCEGWEARKQRRADLRFRPKAPQLYLFYPNQGQKSKCNALLIVLNQEGK
jgi:hypothetical protein